MHIKRIQAPVIAGLLLLMLITPQSVLAAGPEISSVSVTDVTDTSAQISWEVSTNSTMTKNLVRYGTSEALGQEQPGSSGVTNPSVVLTGLTPDTTYYFKVESTDASGTTTDPLVGYRTFKTKTPTTYSITLDHTCGVCGELRIDGGEVKFCNQVIDATVVVAAAGTYYICWDALTATAVVDEFTANAAGTYTRTFFLPESKRGLRDVYLATKSGTTYSQKAKTTFEVSPSVKISPEEGPVGTTVTLDGYGFPASKQIKVTLFQGEIKKGEEEPDTADAKGTWGPISYTIPHTPGGGYIFKVEGKEGTVWVNWVSKYFKVTPEIAVNTDSGTVGQTIKVSGTGFASNEEDIKVTFDGEVRKENIFADVDGSWTTSITVPISTCGRYDIDASGTSTRARDVDDVKFTVVAGVAVTPALAYVGDEITVTGGGFLPGETGIKVSFDGAIVATDIPVDTYGCWESSFALRPSAYGSHTVSASGDTTAAVTTTLNTKTKIEGLSAVERAPGDSVTLTGSGFSSNKKLTVTVGGKNANLEDARSLTNGNVNVNFRVPAGTTEGKQALVVTDEGGASAEWDFTVKKKTLSTTPLPISPKDSTVRSREVTFTWQGVSGGTGYTYTLEINTTAGSGNIFSRPDIEGSSYTLTEEEALPKGTYYWRVKIVDDYGNQSAWSDYVEFRVSPIPTWVWVVIGLVVLVGLMVVAYRETKFKVTE